MSLSLQQSVLNRSLELARGADPDYTPIGLHYVGALDLATTHRALHAFRDVETAAWAQAEHCIVRDIVRLLSRDQEALTRWTLAPAPRDAHLLQNKYGFYPEITDGCKRAENFWSCLATLRRILGLWNRSMYSNTSALAASSVG